MEDMPLGCSPLPYFLIRQIACQPGTRLAVLARAQIYALITVTLLPGTEMADSLNMIHEEERTGQNEKQHFGKKNSICQR
jgi:hypothetical protein